MIMLNVSRISERLARNVANVLVANPSGMTTAEIAAEIGVKRDSIPPRMKGLEVTGYVERTGKFRNRRTVWKAATAY